MKLYTINFMVLFFLFCFFSGTGLGSESVTDEKPEKTAEADTQRIALIPLVNVSGSDAEVPDIISRIEKILSERKDIEIVSGEKVEDYLAKERIRDLSRMSRIVSRRMGKGLNVDGIILTSITLLVPEKNIMIGINCRMLSGHDGSILWCNHASLSGEDLTSWLGLYREKSLDKLTDHVTEILFSTFPEVIEAKSGESNGLLEIMEFSARPGYVHSGESLDIRVKFAATGKKISEVAAVLDNKKFFLSAEEEFIYSGTVTAPDREGKYLMNVEVTDNLEKTVLFNSMAIIKVDDAPPDVTLFSRDTVFSPNGDRVNDFIIISPSLNKPDSIAWWEFVIENSDNQMIRSVEGQNILPETIVWRGEDNFYSPAADGEYFYGLRVKDRAGNETRTPRKVIILDKTPPKVKIDIEIWQSKGYMFRIECEDKNNIDEWRLKILDADYKVSKFFEGTGAVPASLLWETASTVNAGLRYSFVVKDSVGNRRKINYKPLKGKVIKGETSAEEEEKENKENWNYEF